MQQKNDENKSLNDSFKDNVCGVELEIKRGGEILSST